MALAWYKTIASVGEAMQFVASNLNGARNGVVYVAENRWTMTEKALEALGEMLSKRYRTLKFQR